MLTCWEGVRTTVRATRTQSPHFLLRVRSGNPAVVYCVRTISTEATRGDLVCRPKSRMGRVQGPAQGQGWMGSGEVQGHVRVRSCQDQGDVRVTQAQGQLEVQGQGYVRAGIQGQAQAQVRVMSGQVEGVPVRPPDLGLSRLA